MCWRLENFGGHCVVPYHWCVFWTLWIVNIWSSSSVFNTVCQSFPINNQITIARTVLSQLPKNNVLRNSANWIMLSKESSFKQYFASFFERAFPQGSAVNSVNSMSSNRSKNSSVSHHINQCAQVSVVNINIIWPQNNSELSDQAISGCLNSKDLKYLCNIVAGRAFIVNTFKSHNICQVDSICFN